MKYSGRVSILFFGFVTLITSQALAEDWEALPLTAHSTLQAVNSLGESAYSGGYPIRMRGVLLCANYLDPAPDSNTIPFDLGAQWEVFFQSVDTGDFGGTKAYIGQNYANTPLGNYSYDASQWLSEVSRLEAADLTGGLTIQAGDLIEIRARAGMEYRGTLNINEQHNTDYDQATGQTPIDGSGAHDFEILVLERGYGLPEAEQVTLDEVMTFDPTRATGGEHYQSTLIQFKNVHFAESGQTLADGWHRYSDRLLHIQDDLGNELPVTLGDDVLFDDPAALPTGSFDLTGILNQNVPSGAEDFTGGYYLVVTSADQFVAASIPEPATGATLLVVAAATIRGRWR